MHLRFLLRPFAPSWRISSSVVEPDASATIAAMSTTRTGNFPIGFRRGWTDWQKKDLSALVQWANSNGFAALDLMNLTPQDVRSVQSAGLRLGSLDLLDFGAIMSSDTAKRKDTI